ncbi:methyl-accepting chemotaxis protein [Thalassotalea montiporae]
MKLDIRSKVVAASAIVIVLAIALVSTFSIINTRDIVLSNTVDKQMPAVMGEVANSINTDLQRPIAVSRVLATNPDYKQFLASGEQDSAKLSNYLKAIKEEFNATSSFYISDITGNYYTADGILTKVTSNDPGFSWFYGFKASGKPFAVVINIDEANGKMTLFVNYRVEIDGQFKALAGVGFAVDSMAELIRQYKIGEKGIVFLVDGEGKIAAHPDSDKVGQNYFSHIGVDKSALLTKQVFASYELSNAEHHSLLASSYLADLGWYIVADVPYDDVFGQLDSLTYSLVLLGVIIAVVFLVFVTLVITRLISPFSDMTKLLEQIGQGGGDLTIRLDESRTDEVGRMARGYNNFVEHLADILRQVSRAADELQSSVSHVDVKTAEMTDELSVQTQNTEQVATAIDEMGVTAKEIANNAQSAADYSKAAEDLANQGTESVVETLATVNSTTSQLAETTDLVNKLSDNTESIDAILEVIRSVSEQTNLLALNAAIEAARAGEHGRGFAVVADEVRSLASRSHQSAEEIKTTIESFKEQTQVVVESIAQSVELSNSSLAQATKSGEHLEEIVGNMAQVNEMNFQIASATEEQSNVVGEITPHVAAIAEVAQHNSSSLNEMADDSQQLNEMARKLNKLVANFTLD